MTDERIVRPQSWQTSWGVVAGTIASVHLSAKKARILQSIPVIKSDFRNLCEEIEHIDGLVKHAQATIPATATGPIHPKVEQTVKTLRSIARDLEQRERELRKRMGDEPSGPSDFECLIDPSLIAKFLQEACNARIDLTLVVQWQQAAILDRFSSTLSQSPWQLFKTDTATLRQLLVLAERLPPSHMQRKDLQRAKELLNLWKKAVEAAFWWPRTVPSCNDDCLCICHGGPKRHRIHDLVDGILSYASVRDSPPSQNAALDDRCRRKGELVWRVEYRHPLQLMARHWLLSWISGTALGPHRSLRLTKVFSDTDSLWTCIEQPVEVMRNWLLNGGGIFPGDQHETGQEVIEVVINRGSSDVLEFLLMIWGSEELSQRAAWAADEVMASREGMMDERQLDLLQRVVQRSEVRGEPATSRVHEAAKHGHGVAEALRKNSWARDALDGSGRAPLHWAAARCHIEAMQQLIDAGADVDIRDRVEWTPLMFAALEEDADIVRQLLDAGCRIDSISMTGRTALHVAARGGSAEIISMLLRAEEEEDAGITRGVGADTKVRKRFKMAASVASYMGHLPLHELAYSFEEGATTEAIEETARLLLDAYPDSLETRDRNGHTPVIIAVVRDNLPALRFLVRTGASLNIVDANGRNLLHLVATYSSAPTIHFLLKDGCEGKRLLSTNQLTKKGGYSPWDMFVVSMYMPPWQLGTLRHARSTIQASFVKIYQRIRDGNLRQDISDVRDALVALQEGQLTTARDHLYALAQRKSGTDDSAAAWYRAMAKHIGAGEMEAVTAGLKEDWHELQEELQSSPWDQHSDWDYLAAESQWVEVAENCFWVEPATAFSRRRPLQHQEPDNEGQQHEPPSDLPSAETETNIRTETELAASNGCLNCELIERIYSQNGHLLYDRQTATYGPSEFFEALGKDLDDHEPGYASGSEAGSEMDDVFSRNKQVSASSFTSPAEDEVFSEGSSAVALLQDRRTYWQLFQERTRKAIWEDAQEDDEESTHDPETDVRSGNDEVVVFTERHPTPSMRNASQDDTYSEVLAAGTLLKDGEPPRQQVQESTREPIPDDMEHRNVHRYSVPLPLSLPNLVEALWYWFRLGWPEPQVPPGKRRIRWTCSCGVKLYGDYDERSDSAALDDLEDRLQKLSLVQKASDGGANLLTRMTSWVLGVTGRVAQLFKARPQDETSEMGLPTYNMTAALGANPTDTAGVAQQLLYLLYCTSTGTHGAKFHQIVIDDNLNDQGLFNLLRTAYTRARGRGKWFTLRTIASISLCKFFVDHSCYASILRHDQRCMQGQIQDCVCLPPTDLIGLEYQCHPVPSNLLPPFEKNYLMHYFLHPCDLSAEQVYTFTQLPKRMHDTLQPGTSSLLPGWGVYFEEGWHFKTIYLLLSISTIVGTLIFGICWSVLKMDIQAAFGITSYWVTVVAMGMGYLALWSTDRPS